MLEDEEEDESSFEPNGLREEVGVEDDVGGVEGERVPTVQDEGERT